MDIHFSLLCWSQNFSLTSCTKTMAKRMQEQEGKELIVAKSKPTLNLVTHVATSSSTVQNPIASKNPVIFKAFCFFKMIRQVQGDLEQENSIKTEHRVLKAGKRCSLGCEYEEIRSDRRRRPGTPQFPSRFEKYEETRRFKKLRNRRQRQNLATQSPNYLQIACRTWRRFSQL